MLQVGVEGKKKTVIGKITVRKIECKKKKMVENFSEDKKKAFWNVDIEL